MNIIGAIKALDSAGDELLYLRVTGGLYLLIVRSCLDQSWHDHFEVCEGQRPGYIVLAS